MIKFLDIFAWVIQWIYAFVFFWILRTFLPLRKNRLVQIAAFVVSTFFSALVVYSQDLQILMGLLGFIAYIWAFHRGHWMEKLAAVLVFYPALVAVNYLMLDISSRLFFWFSNAPGGTSAGWTREMWMMNNIFYAVAQLMRLGFWVGAWLFLRRHLNRIISNLTTRMWLVVDVLMAAPLVAVFTAIYFTQDAPWMVYPICATAVFSSFGCIYLAAYICNSVQTAYRIQRLEMQRAYYKDRIADEKLVRSIYHDMKNHLLVLQAQGNGEIQKSVAELENQIQEYENYHHTGNEFLDIIIRDKAKAAREKQIDFSAVIQFKEGDFIEPLDISTVFGNALDNAIEASERIEPDRRLITVKASPLRDMLVIVIENNTDWEEEQPEKTTKEDDFLHGFGLSNIMKTVKKYDGECRMKKEKGVFSLKIVIPIPS